MVSRILYQVMLIACGGQDSDQASGSAQNSDLQAEPADSLSQKEATFVRLLSSSDQTNYVPVYSHIYQQSQQPDISFAGRGRVLENLNPQSNNK